MAGRYDELTPEVSEALLKAVSECHYPDYACALVGIDRSTMRIWVRRGRNAARRAASEEEVEEHDRLHVALFRGLARVVAERTRRNLTEIERQGKEDWRALAWVEERVDPLHFGSMAPELRERDKREAALLAEVEQLRARLAAIPVQVPGQVVDGTPPQLPPPNGTSQGHNGSNGNGTNGNGKH